MLAPPLVRDALQGRGQPLDARTRAFFEPRFGHDFSRVRVHTDAAAASSARGIHALAYAVGDDVVFAPGQYAPGTAAGNRLLAHELAHTVQQAPVIARQSGIIPSGPIQTGGPALERALNYQPRLRPHVPQAPAIPAPPIMVDSTDPLPDPCPSAASVISQLRASDVATATETEMQREINLAQSRVAASGTTQATPSLLQEADRAIRAEFAGMLPAGRSYTAAGSITIQTPAQFAQTRAPDAATARERVAKAALETRGTFLRSLCITDESDTNLQTVVGGAVLASRGISFVRDHQASRIGGMTSYPVVQGQVAPHVTLPSTSRNMGHIAVHEAMHFYVGDGYRRTADVDPREHELMEGGAEFLARHVINQRLANRPEFTINTGTYSQEFNYVARYLMNGGLSGFELAYFQGRVDLLGLPVRPKLEISQPGDPLEQEADRAADTVLAMEEAGAREASVPAPAHSRADRGEAAPALVRETLRAAGDPLDPATRSLMEGRFGQDFGHVRLHSDGAAAASARAIDAAAYTMGSDVVLLDARYGSATGEGRGVLAHELAHVVQQRGAAPAASDALAVAPQHHPAEREAETVASAVVAGQPASVSASLVGQSVQRLGAGNTFLRYFGIEAGEFSPEDLQSYLDSIVKLRQHIGGTLDDDRARALINAGGVNKQKLDQDYKGVSSIEIRRILLEELLDGPTGDLDEKSIIKLLSDSTAPDILAILDPAKGLSIANLESDVSGDNLAELYRVLAKKLPDVGKPQVDRSETPGAVSGACTASRAIKISFAHAQAGTLIQNAIDLIDKYGQQPAEYKQTGEAIQCQFKGAGKPDIDLIKSNLQQMRAVLPNIRYVCPAEPFTGYKTSTKDGVTVLEHEEGTMAQALIVEKPSSGAGPVKAAPTADKAAPVPAADASPKKVALYPEFFDLSPAEQASDCVHESYHHAKPTGATKEKYAPSCGQLDKAVALDNADSYAALVMSLRNDRLTFDVSDCPQAWKDELIAASRTGQLWVNAAVARLDAALANPHGDFGKTEFQLHRHFKIALTDTAKLKQVRDVFAEIQSAFGGALPFECETECSADTVAGYVGGFLWSPRGGNIHLCPHWFEKLDPLEKAETIVHEMAHRFGGRGEVKYFKGNFNEYRVLSFDKLLDNADSFAQFARYLQEQPAEDKGGAP
jgi:Domain of unknown function (DUF4157)/Lysine-specific metallo-endopeptidase